MQDFARRGWVISIHASHAGCDWLESDSSLNNGLISIHAPHTGCDALRARPHGRTRHFNPRTPYRVRRDAVSVRRRRLCNFNPRTPCRVRRYPLGLRGIWLTISIHAPHAGCDRSIDNLPSRPQKFQSTHPMQGATYWYVCEHDVCTISIHAPHAGCDWPPHHERPG